MKKKTKKHICLLSWSEPILEFTDFPSPGVFQDISLSACCCVSTQLHPFQSAAFINTIISGMLLTDQREVLVDVLRQVSVHYLPVEDVLERFTHLLACPLCFKVDTSFPKYSPSAVWCLAFQLSPVWLPLFMKTQLLLSFSIILNIVSVTIWQSYCF